MKFYKITMKENKKSFYIEVDKEDTKFIMGMEVDKEGIWIAPKGYNAGRMRIIQKSLIAKTIAVKINNKYGVLQKT